MRIAPAIVLTVEQKNELAKLSRSNMWNDSSATSRKIAFVAGHCGTCPNWLRPLMNMSRIATANQSRLSGLQARATSCQRPFAPTAA